VTDANTTPDRRRFRTYLLIFGSLTPALMLGILAHDLFASQSPALVAIVARLSQDPADVLCFGDSINRACGARDKDRRAISLLLQEKGDYGLIHADGPASSAIIYQDWLKIVATLPHRPEFVIMPINMRSFSGAWFTNPDYLFELERVRGRLRYLGLSIAGLGQYLDCRFTGRIAREKLAWRRAPVVYGDLDLGTRASIDERGLVNSNVPLEYLEGHDFDQPLAVQFRYHYMNVITRQHGMFAAMDKSIAGAVACGSRVICYVSPINYEDGARIVGPEFTKRLRANLAVIEDYFVGKPVRFENMATSLSADYFVDKRTTSEHVNSAGREFIAARLHEIIQRERATR